MNQEVLILGAGPGGLTAAYWLLKQGINVTIVEKEQIVGGLMRAVKHKDYMVDLGYKQLYTRIPEVHEFWQEILGGDYLPYKPRTGILYKGHIIERNKTYRGLRRGMPYGLLLSSLANMIKYHYRGTTITSLEDYSYAKRGGKFTWIFSQGFDERFKGLKWRELPAPKTLEKKGRLWERFISDANKPSQKQENWFHPAKGSGQIMEILEYEIVRMGGKICLGCEMKKIDYAGGRINSVIINEGDAQMKLTPQILISSLPLQFLAPIMGIDFAPSDQELSFRRGVVMVYLFLNKKPLFPHTSLEISCPKTLMSRITNYGAYGGRMVNDDKGCLCIEYFTSAAAQVFVKSDDEIFQLAVKECEQSGLLNTKDCTDFIVIKNANADPATSWEDYTRDASRQYIYSELSKFNNFYHINRSGTDKSTYAGLMAARAISSGDKALFDSTTRPDICI